VNVLATISVTSCVVGLLFALLTLGMSTGPGWRELRWYALAAGVSGLYSATNVVVNVGASDRVVTASSSVSLLLTGVVGSAWYAYSAAREGRRMHRWERVIVTVALAGGLAALVPGLLFDGVMAHEVRWAAIVYRDAVPTALGGLVFAFYCVAFVALTVRHAAAAVRGAPYAWPHAVGLGALCLSGIHDSFASAGVVAMPYLVDLGTLAANCAVGGALVSRFVASARRLEQASLELREAQGELVQRERLAALGELAAIVAHEVRNPVGVLFNAVAQLRKHSTDDEGRALVGIVQEEAERLRRMVDGLLLFTRRSVVQREDVLVPALVRSAVRAATDAMPQHRGTVRVDAPDDVGTLSCDESLVRQALLNLIANAMQAAPEGEVRVSARAVGGGAVSFTVEDDGPGVAAELRERIFAPFFTTRPTGTGLGLAIVRRVAEAHGGTVELAPGRGARFVMTVPPDRASRRRILAA
jgi:two-component system sensor histidine kinase HydH